MSAELGSRDDSGRVAIPLENPPSKPTLIPDDVWHSYQKEIAQEQAPEDDSEMQLLEDSEFDEIPSEAFKASVTADHEVALLALSRVPLFSSLQKAGLELLAQAARQGEVPAGEYLFLEGQPADCFYVVLDGALEVLRRREGREVTLRHMEQGEATGVFGLLSGQTRAASARAMGDAVVLEVPCASLNALIQRDAATRERVVRFYEERLLETFLGSSKIFADLDAQGRARIISRFTRRRLKPGDPLLQPGEVCNLFAVLVTGQVHLELKPKGPAADARTFELSPAEFLAVTSAFTGTPCRVRAYAADEVTLVMLGQRELSELVRDYPALRTLSTRLSQHARMLDRDVFCGHTGSPAP